MEWFYKSQAYPIGIDMGADMLKMVQFCRNGKGLKIIAAGSRQRPEDVKPGSAEWQKWVIESIQQLSSQGKYQGKEVVAAMPTNDVFIENVRVPKSSANDLQEVVSSKMKQKFGIDRAVIKHIPINDGNVLAIAVEQEKINRYLAIYEHVHLQIKSIDIWAEALINGYVRFFGKRRSDIGAIIMLLDINAKYTNLVICCHRQLLFARCIPIGANHLENEEMTEKLISEITACRREHALIHGKDQIERLVFLSGLAADKDVSLSIAKSLEIPSQIGDFLAAVETSNTYRLGIDRRESQFSWATAFGLSLSYSTRTG